MSAETVVAPPVAPEPDERSGSSATLPVHVRRRWPALIVGAVQLLLDVALIAAAFLIAYHLDASLMSSGFIPPSGRTYLAMLVVLEIMVLVSFNVAGLYTLKRGVGHVDEFAKICS